MTFAERELLVSRIISGLIIIDKYEIHAPDKILKYKANLLYTRLINELKYDKLYTEEQVIKLMMDNGLWTIKDEEKWGRIQTDIEDFKVKLYSLYYKSNEKAAIRNILGVAKKDFIELGNRRATYSHLLIDNIATICKTHYIFLNTVYKNGQLIEEEDLPNVMWFLSQNKIDEKQYRELARTEPWRSVWSCANKDSLFNFAVVDYTDEQKMLVFWSKMYDNIYEHSSCPPEDIVNDDDVLDGWLIKQRRERERQLGQNQASSITDKHADADEVFIMADTPEDAKKIHELNDTRAKMIKAQKFAMVNKHGTINDVYMPDMQEKLSKTIVEYERQQMNKGK